MEFKWQALYDKKVIVRPSFDPRGQNENSKSLLQSTRHAHSYPRVSVVYSWNCRCSSTDKLYRKIETSFFDPDLTPRDKMKIPKPFCTSARHTKSYPKLSFVYSMKCRQSSSENNCTKNVLFNLYEMKILKPYCASARHAQWDPRVSFV